MSLGFFFALGVNVENVIRKGKNVVMSERRKKIDSESPIMIYKDKSKLKPMELP